MARGSESRSTTSTTAWRPALAVAIGASLWSQAARAGESYSFSGAFAPKDSGSYHLLDFEVPAGTARVHVSYSFESTGTPSELFSNVVDIGLFDAEGGFRGWSGSAKSAFTVAFAAADTTDGYVAGAMPAGTWQVELGAGYTAAKTSTPWLVNVTTEDGDGEAEQPSTWPGAVLAGPGWYAGDLHCHSNRSDGAYPVADVVAFAHELGLDFLALTDHNAFTGRRALGDLQLSYDDLALLRGLEVTTYRGHSNVFGLARYVDYHATADGYDIDAVMDDVHTGGGLWSVNHPDAPTVEPASGVTVSLGWTVAGTDFGKVDFMEVVNGLSSLEGVMANPVNEAAIKRFDQLLLDGRRVVAVGGSDDHLAGQGSTEESFYYAPIGTPTTVVYAEELSEAGILAGLKSGRVYLRAVSPAGPELGLTADCGQGPVEMGAVATGGRCRVAGRAVGAAGSLLRVVVDGAILEQVEVTSDAFEHASVVEPGPASYARVELRQGSSVLAFANPVFLQDGPGGWVDPAVPDDESCACSAPGRAGPRAGGPWLVVLALALGTARGRRRRRRGLAAIDAVFLAKRE